MLLSKLLVPLSAILLPATSTLALVVPSEGSTSSPLEQRDTTSSPDSIKENGGRHFPPYYPPYRPPYCRYRPWRCRGGGGGWGRRPFSQNDVKEDETTNAQLSKRSPFFFDSDFDDFDFDFWKRSSSSADDDDKNDESSSLSKRDLIDFDTDLDFIDFGIWKREQQDQAQGELVERDSTTSGGGDNKKDLAKRGFYGGGWRGGRYGGGGGRFGGGGYRGGWGGRRGRGWGGGGGWRRGGWKRSLDGDSSLADQE